MVRNFCCILNKISLFLPSECTCDEDGSTSFICDVNSGQCPCKENIGGLNCDESSNGYWNWPNPEGKYEMISQIPW